MGLSLLERLTHLCYLAAMPVGSMLTVHTARAMALLYAAGLALMLGGRWREGRVVWTLGCVMLWVHVAAAFHFVHGWSHVHALEQTADQTAAMAGVRSGAGVYLNYLVMLVWAADVAFWRLAGSERYRRRSLAITASLHGFLLFMMFNAAVVFVRGGTRYVGVAIAVLLVVLAVKRLRVARDAVIVG